MEKHIGINTEKNVVHETHWQRYRINCVYEQPGSAPGLIGLLVGPLMSQPI